MVWKVISLLAVFILVVFSFAFMLDNLPRDSVELEANYLEPETSKIIEYGTVPIFAEKMRFSQNLISYSIEEDCDDVRRNDMIGAFNVFSEMIKVVSFYEFSDNGSNNFYESEADIMIECSDEYIELSNGLFTAGEGGPSRIVNTSGFKVIEEGTILLYKSESCNYPIVALHELGHVFGFSHSEDPSNIMYNTSRCDQRMSEDMVDIMRELYSIESLPDVRIDDASAIVSGRYLNFNISVLNEGLGDVDNVYLGIIIDGESVDNVEVGEIEVGYGRTLRVENMRVPRLIEKIEFVIDADDLVRELDEDNNVVEMIL